MFDAVVKGKKKIEEQSTCAVHTIVQIVCRQDNLNFPQIEQWDVAEHFVRSKLYSFLSSCASKA